MPIDPMAHQEALTCAAKLAGAKMDVVTGRWKAAPGV